MSFSYMMKGGNEMTNDPQIHAALICLEDLGSSERRSKTSKIRDLMPKIEDLKAQGHTNKQVWQSLSLAGIVMSLKTFESVLHRIRQQKTNHSDDITPSKPSKMNVASLSNKDMQKTPRRPITPGDYFSQREAALKESDANN